MIKIENEYIKSILALFNINKCKSIVPIHYGHTWDIDGRYILKECENEQDLKKSIQITERLLKINLPVSTYVRNNCGKLYINCLDKCYCLMNKIKGYHLDPFIGDVDFNGVILGRAVANLHKGLKSVEQGIQCYNCDNIEQIGELISNAQNNKYISQKIVCACFDFKNEYDSLPRQLIHRDVYCGNLLFDNEKISGYLDFESAEFNVRIYDLCYLAAQMLVSRYIDLEDVVRWKKIFSSMISEYNKFIPLTDKEINAMPMMILIKEIQTLYWYISMRKPSEVILDRISMINWLFDNQHEIYNCVSSIAF